MTKYVLIAFLFLGVVSKGFSQTNLSDYSYVIVPEQFDFLNAKDKYQLNSIGKFLFNKYGFNAYLSNEAPNADRCDGLYMDLQKNNTYFKTKFTILLKDCTGTVIYTSAEGISKLKEFKKSHQDAFRKAFKSIQTLGVNQKEVVLISERPETTTKAKKEPAKVTLEKEVASEEEPNSTRTIPKINQEVNPAVKAPPSNLPESKFSSYYLEGKSFMLQKTTDGYSLYQETSQSDNGLVLKGRIIKVGDKMQFVDKEGNIFWAWFSKSRNLNVIVDDIILEYEVVD